MKFSEGKPFAEWLLTSNLLVKFLVASKKHKHNAAFHKSFLSKSSLSYEKYVLLNLLTRLGGMSNLDTFSSLCINRSRQQEVGGKMEVLRKTCKIIAIIKHA